MNSKARNKARQAELEDYLLEKFYKIDKGSFGDFADWIEGTAGAVCGWGWKSEANELIALYESNL
jgi:hypothetical protein